MKKLSLLVLIVFLFALAGCVATPSQSVGAAGGSAADAPITTTMPFNEHGYYYVHEVYPLTSTLIYIDYATRQEVPLCNRPECLHNDETCQSYYPSLGLMEPFVLHDSLYFFYNEGDNNHPTALMRADLDGSNLQKLLELPASYFLLPYGIYTDGSRLYFMADDMQETAEEELEECMTLLEIDMSTWELDVMHQFPAGELGHILVGKLGRKLIFNDTLVDQNGEFYGEFLWFDVDTREFSSIQAMGPDADAASGIEGEYLYVQNYALKTITQTHLFTGESKSYDYSSIFLDNTFKGDIANAGFEILFEDYFRIAFAELIPGEETQFYEYLLDRETGEITPFTLFQSFRPSQNVIILADLGDTLLVRPDWVTDTQTIDGHTNPMLTPRHAFISKQDYLQSVPNYEYIPTFLTDVLPGQQSA